MKAQSSTLRLEIPLKPICLDSGKVGAFEGLWRAIQEPEKSAERGAKGAGTSAEGASQPRLVWGINHLGQERGQAPPPATLSKAGQGSAEQVVR